MQNSPLSFSLLTLAIATASLSAKAEIYQIDNGPKSWGNEVIADGLAISGNLTTPANAVTLQPGTHVQGDLTVDATIYATGAESGQSRYARPVTIGGTQNDQVLIDGALVNKGSLITGGSAAVGIKASHTHINGGISNEGLISIRNSNFLTPSGQVIGDSMPAGISLYETKLSGRLSNSGQIEVSSADVARGIELSNSDSSGAKLDNTSSGVIDVSGDEANAVFINFGSALAELSNAGIIRATGIPSIGDTTDLSEAAGITVGSSIVHGTLSNSGSIIVSGYEAAGIDLRAYNNDNASARIGADLLNSGSISVTAAGEDGATARGIELSYGQIGGVLDNSGTVVAKGANSDGIHVAGSLVRGGISNSGTIQGDRHGIYLSDFTHDRGDPLKPNYSIVNKGGGITGGQYAIYAEPNGSTLRINLAGGTLKGNISGIGYIAVTGDTIFDGTRIENGRFSGQQLSVVDLFNADDSPLGTPGRLTLVQPHVTIDGELEMNRGSQLQLNLSNATDPNRAILTVRDVAYFSSQSTIALRPTSEAFRASGTEYKLIQAREIEYDGTNLVVSSSPLLTVDSSRITSTEVLATVSSVSGQQAGEILGQAGSSPNARSAFQPFYANVMPQLNSSDPVFQAFANADEGQLAALSEQLTPQVDGAVQAAANAVQSMVSGAVGSRTSSLRGASSGSPFSETGFWVQGHDSDLRQGRRSGIAGYDADSRGLSLGLDGKLDEQWTLGVAYSNLDTKVSGRTGNKSEIDSQVLTLYSGFEQGPVFVDTSLSYGFNDNTSKRSIAGTRAKGDFDSQSLALNLEAGYGLHAGSVTLEPRVATRYSRLDIDSYREKGSSAALAVSSQRYETIELGAGARLASQFSVGQGTLEPELKLMAYHDFAADRASSTSSFVLGGSSFVTHGASPARDSYEASLGVNYRLGALSLGAGYEHVGRSGFDADTLRAKVRYDF